ncbi:hypothetical protein DM02DRAFT_685069 [Periconia macrospinosa]|uniref:Rhodopsin domain-containing protein n=1 Tax=Periconia macrospinosa TaxID=97972 RepID=A0A2V1DHD2_9PLEO|nr:hypothetical protein DM02DRAFT_685069 [Periconia macrospinosa]
MASGSPPGPDTSIAPLLMGITAGLHVLSWSAFGARIYTRVKPVLRLGCDDFFITAAVTFDVVTWTQLMISTSYGLGRHNHYVSAAKMMQAEKFLFTGQPAFAWALACAKISIVCMLFRVQTGISGIFWRSFLSIMIVVQVLTAIMNNIFQFSLCKPLPAIWDHTIKNPKCIVAAMHINIIVTAVITILTDVILSLLPLTFILRMLLPLREKIALACLMGLGLIASAASIYKTFLAKHYGVGGDTLRDAVKLTLCAMIELQLGILASCIPCLRQFMDKVLRRLGLLSDNRSTTHIGYGSLGNSQNSQSQNSQSYELSKMRSNTPQHTRISRLRSTNSEESILPFVYIPAGNRHISNRHDN